MSYEKLNTPQHGDKITVQPDGSLNVPNNPIIPFIEGDGTGPDIWAASVKVLDAAVEKAYGGSKKIEWFEVFAGEKSNEVYGPNTWLPEDTAGAEDTSSLLSFLETSFPAFHKKIRFGSESPELVGLGIKPVSAPGSKRLIRAALKYAISQNRKSLTLVHKGNIMKFTEGAFRDWGYELVKEEFSDVAIGWDDCGGNSGDKLLVKDSIADAFLQQILTRPAEYDVIATLNLNGDYISDALAAQVGGIGIAPGANINYDNGYAIFEATHGTAPKYAGLDKVNPGSVILSGEMMFRYLGWNEAADLIIKGMDGAISAKTVTYDFARLMDGATEVSCSAFGDAIIQHM